MSILGCCPNCFGDGYLKDEVFPQYATGHGVCTYCGATDQALIDPIFFRDSFEALLGIYSQCEDGVRLIEHLRHDWDLFPQENISDQGAEELLARIFDDVSISLMRFRLNDHPTTNSLDSWQVFKEELCHHNRFFLKSDLNLDRIKILLGFLEYKPSIIPTRLFRARIQESDKPFPLSQMGPPPARLASHGRANPPGIPYLYMASDPKTAISELRPYTNDITTVAALSLSPGLMFVDLRFPRQTASPFRFGDEDQLMLLQQDLTFLDQLGTELTRPVNPRSAHIEYLPSQYLCEFIKHCGYDGVIYRSSVAAGINYALFYPEKASLTEIATYSVDKVSVDISEAS